MPSKHQTRLIPSVTHCRIIYYCWFPREEWVASICWRMLWVSTSFLCFIIDWYSCDTWVIMRWYPDDATVTRKWNSNELCQDCYVVNLWRLLVIDLQQGNSRRAVLITLFQLQDTHPLFPKRQNCFTRNLEPSIPCTLKVAPDFGSHKTAVWPASLRLIQCPPPEKPVQIISSPQ